MCDQRRNELTELTSEQLKIVEKIKGGREGG